MDAHTYIATRTRREIERTCDDAGTKLIYLKQIATGFRKCSWQLAVALESASGGAMTAQELRPDIAASFRRGGAKKPRRAKKPQRLAA